jgi:hypothetical protein
MAKCILNIELDDPILISTVAGKPLPVDMSKMPNNALVKLITYGVQRQFNDGVGGKDVPADDKIAAATAKIAAFLNGEIRATRGVGETELLRVSRRVAEAAFIAAKGKDSAEAKAVADMEAADWAEKMDSILAKNGDKLQPAIVAQMEELARARAAKAAAKVAAASVELDLE